MGVIWHVVADQTVFIAQAPGATNPRSLSPAAPIGGFGGVRVTF
jgi:hypothetical protein